MRIIDEAKHENERAWPVRAAVRRNAVEVREAREAGVPLATIYRILVRRGEKVGKGPSSFRAAIRYLDQHGWEETKSVASAADRFVDTRFKNDF